MNEYAEQKNVKYECIHVVLHTISIEVIHFEVLDCLLNPFIGEVGIYLHAEEKKVLNKYILNVMYSSNYLLDFSNRSEHCE